jgi:high-affinity iron transporter
LVCFVGSAVNAGEIAGTLRLPPSVDGKRSPAVAYIAARASAAQDSAPTIVVDQKGFEFSPRVQAIPLGGRIVFRNSDRESHNVNSQSDCCAFNFMIGPASDAGPSESEPFTPARPGLVRLLCNIHAQMRGFVMVCPSPMFDVADSQGSFRIQSVPDGKHRLVVWQESCVQVSQEVDVSGTTNVTIELEAASAVRSALPARRARAVVPWREVLTQITSKLETAAQLAQESGSVAQADSWALDAYFECFEASQLETAVLLFRGEERTFVVERMFARIRRPMLADLAAGRIELAAVQAAIDDLAREIELDIRELDKRGIVDRASLSSGATSRAISPSRRLAAADISRVMTELREALDNVHRLAATGNASAAASALADAYFEIFHRIEPTLASHNFTEMRHIEGLFLECRGNLQSGKHPDIVRTELDSLWSTIDSATASIGTVESNGITSAVTRFWNAFLILVREGVEALLIVTALLMYIERSGGSNGKRSIYGGVICGLAATLVTWTSLQWLIARSGIAQEVIEGLAALAAAAVLFYVSYWLISKSEARRWQQFLSRQVDRQLSSGSRWAIASAAFLAVYREGAETILMLQPMLVQPSRGELAGAAAGAAAAAIALVAAYWALRFATVRMAIRPFFRVTGALLFTLAIVFAGKGVTELQEARLLAITPLAPATHALVMAIPVWLRDVLGIVPNVQSLAIQGIILAGALLSLLSMWLMPSSEPEERAPRKPERSLVSSQAS